MPEKSKKGFPEREKRGDGVPGGRDQGLGTQNESLTYLMGKRGEERNFGEYSLSPMRKKNNVRSEGNSPKKKKSFRKKKRVKGVCEKKVCKTRDEHKKQKKKERILGM